MSGLTLLLFILQIIVSIILIILVTVQSSDEDSLSGIGAGASQSNLVSHSTSVDFITKLTISCGILLMLNSFILTAISTHNYVKEKNIIKDYIEQTEKQNKDIIKN